MNGLLPVARKVCRRGRALRMLLCLLALLASPFALADAVAPGGAVEVPPRAYELKTTWSAR